MNIKERIYRLKNYNVVQHAVYNPLGHGRVNMRLVPSKSAYINKSDIVIVNNKYVVPIEPAWSILLSCFMKNINKLNGKAIDSDELELYINMSVEDASKIYMTVPKVVLSNDLRTIIDVLYDIAKGKDVLKNINQQHIADYSKYLKGPIRAFIFTCNSTRNYCINNEHDDNYTVEKRLKFEEWKKVLKKLKNACVPQIVFISDDGNVPFDLIEEAKWFLTELEIHPNNLDMNTCKKLYEISLDKIIIPIDLVDDEIKSSDLKAIENCIKTGLNVTVNIVITESYKSIIDVVKVCEKLGVTDFNLTINGDFEKNDVNAVYALMEETAIYAEEKSLQLNLKTPKIFKEEKIKKIKIENADCGAALYEIAIKDNGDVVPCISCKSQKYVIGNVLKEDFESIWQKMRIKKMRKLVLSKELGCPLKHFMDKN